MTVPYKIIWLVEDMDYNTREIIFSASYHDEMEAREVYEERSSLNGLNTVSMRKVEKYLLQE